MKRRLAIIVAAILLLFMMYCAGHKEGMRHALEDSIIYTVERYDPEHPEDTARPDGTDQTIYIEIDNELWVHGMYQG